MDFWGTLFDLVVLLAGAMVLGMLLERLKQSAILGYLLAGTLLGPGALDLMGNREVVSVLAELGVALLLFTIGLEFSWRRLLRLGPVALGGGAVQVVLTALVAGGICLGLGMGARQADALGAMVALSSTACVLRMLTDRAEVDSVHGRFCLGFLLLQDLAVVPLVILVTILSTGGPLTQVLAGFGRAGGLTILFILAVFLFTNYVLRRLLDVTALTRNRELPILLTIVVFLLSVWAAHTMGLSPALGAFVTGLLLAESPFATQIRADVAPLRTVFVTLFFTSIGMLADLSWIAQHWLLATTVVVAVIVGKALLIWFVLLGFRVSHLHALATGICLGQVGEFSFVLAGTAFSGGLVTQDTFQLIVAATLGTLFLSPYLVASALRVSSKVENTLVAMRLASVRVASPFVEKADWQDHVIVVGYGPAGQGVVDAIRNTDALVVVAELNPRTAAKARSEGIRTQVADASNQQILDHLEVASAQAVVVTLPDYRTALQVIRQTRALAPHVPIVARARYHIYAEELKVAGAHVVIDEEQQVGRLLGEEVLRRLK